MDKQRKWNAIIINWIKCLNISGLKSMDINLCNYEIFYHLIKYLQNIPDENDKQDKSRDEIIKFLERKYPHFRETNLLNDGACVASLLLHYSCTKSQDETVRETMCERLSASDQHAIMSFIKSLMKSKRITELELQEAMQVASSEIFDVSIPSSAQSPSPFSVPASPLRLLLNSPCASPGLVCSQAASPLGTSPAGGPKGRRSRKLMLLEAALESERFDRNYLQDEVKRQAEKIEEMTKQQTFYLSELNHLRCEVQHHSENSIDIGNGDTAKTEHQIQMLERQRRDAASLEKELLLRMEETTNLVEEKQTLQNKISELEKDLVLWRSQAVKAESAATEHCRRQETLQAENTALRQAAAETAAILEGYRTQHHLNTSIECDDDLAGLGRREFSSGLTSPAENLGKAVIDVQLREQINRNNSLLSQLDEVRGEGRVLERALSAAEDALNQRGEQLDKCQAVNDKLKRLLESSRKAIKEKETLLATCETEKKEFINTMQQLEEKNMLNEALAKTNSDEINKLHLLLREAELKLETEENVMQRKNTQIETLTKREKKFEEQIIELKDNISNKDEELAQQKHMIDNINLKYKESTVQHELVVSKRDEYKNKLILLNKRYSLLIANKQEREKSIKIFQANLLACRRVLIKRRIYINDLNENKAQLVEMLNSSNAEVESYKQMLQDKVDALHMMISEKMSLQNAKVSLETVIDACDKENIKLKNKLENAEDLYHQMQKEMNVLTRNIENLEMGLENKQTLIDGLTEKNMKLSETNDENVDKIDEFERKIISQTSLIDQLNAETADMQGALDTAHSNLTASSEVVKDLTNKLTAIEDKYLNLDNIYNLKNKEADDVILENTQLKNEVNNFNEKILNYHQDIEFKIAMIEETSQENQNLKNEIASMSADKESILIQLEDLQKINENIVSQKEKMAAENCKMVEEIKAFEKSMSDLNISLEKIQQEKREVEVQVEKTNKNNELLLKENNELTEEAIKVTQEMKDIKEDLNMKTKVIEELQLCKIELENKIRDCEVTIVELSDQLAGSLQQIDIATRKVQAQEEAALEQLQNYQKSLDSFNKLLMDETSQNDNEVNKKSGDETNNKVQTDINSIQAEDNANCDRNNINSNIAVFKDKLKASVENYLTVTTENRKLVKKLNIVEGVIGEKSKQIKNICDEKLQLEQVIAKRDEEIKNYCREVEESQEVCETLKDKLRDITETHNNVENQFQLFVADIESKMTHLESLICSEALQKIHNIVYEANTQDKTEMDVREKIQFIESILEKSLDKIKCQENEINNITKAKNETEKMMLDLSAEKNNLEEEINDLKNTLSETKSKIEYVSQELKLYKDENNKLLNEKLDFENDVKTSTAIVEEFRQKIFHLISEKDELIEEYDTFFKNDGFRQTQVDVDQAKVNAGLFIKNENVFDDDNMKYKGAVQHIVKREIIEDVNDKAVSGHNKVGFEESTLQLSSIKGIKVDTVKNNSSNIMDLNKLFEFIKVKNETTCQSLKDITLKAENKDVELSFKEKEIKMFKETNCALQTSINLLKEKNEKLEELELELQDKLKYYQEEFVCQMGQLKSCKNDIKNSINVIEEYKNEITMLKNEILSKENDVQMYLKEKTNLQSFIESQAAQLQENNDKLATRVIELQEINSDNVKRTQNFEILLSAKNAEIEVLCHERYENDIMLERFKNNLMEKDMKIEELTKEITEQCEKLINLENSLEDKNVKITNLNNDKSKQCEELAGKIIKYEESLLINEKNIEQVLKEKERSMEKLLQLEKLLEEKNAEISSITECNEQQGKKCDEHLIIIKKYEEHVVLNDDKLAKLETDNTICNEQINNYKQKLEEENKRVEDLSKNIKKLESLDDQLQLKNKDYAECVEKIQLLEEKLSLKSEQVNDLLMENEKLNKFLDTLKYDCSQLMGADDVEVFSDNNKSEDENAGVKYQYDKIKLRLTELYESTEAISKSCAKNVIEKDEMIEKLSVECDQLKEELSSLNILLKNYQNAQSVTEKNSHLNNSELNNETFTKVKESSYNVDAMKQEIDALKVKLKTVECNENALNEKLCSNCREMTQILNKTDVLNPSDATYCLSENSNNAVGSGTEISPDLINNIKTDNKKSLPNKSGDVESHFEVDKKNYAHADMKQDVTKPSQTKLMIKNCEEYTNLLEKLQRFDKERLSMNEATKLLKNEVAIINDRNEELNATISIQEKLIDKIEKENIELKAVATELQLVKQSEISLSESLLRLKDDYRKVIVENTNLTKEVDVLVITVKELKEKLHSELTMAKEAHEKLQLENQKLAIRGDADALVADVRNEYEDKLSRMKQKMRQLYQEHITETTAKQKEEMSGLEALCKKYSEKIKSYEGHVNQLSSELWKVGEKLLMERNEKEFYKQKLKEQSTSQQSLRSIGSTISLPQTRAESEYRNERKTLPRTGNKPAGVVDKKPQSTLSAHNRELSFKDISTSTKVESGGLHMSDEEGEVFDNTYLAAMKSGAPMPPPSGSQHQPDRLSELQWRNSLCLPHLKSSYPAETQFQTRLRENDIKMGSQVINPDEATCSDKPRPKKEAGQTSYKKPGPPTPSKNGGRHSLQGNEREPLKEQNENVCVKKATTPSRIKSLFLGNNSSNRSKNENSFGTPKGRRLSIFRKPR